MKTSLPDVGEFVKDHPLSFSSNGHTSGGINAPFAIAVDSAGNAWLTNQGSNSVTEIIGIGTPVITPIAAGLPVTPTPDRTSNLGTRP